MSTDIQLRFCLVCNKQVRGRTDKKFCDDNCRNNYNNQLKASSKNFSRNINNILSKNRRILESVLSQQLAMARVKKDELIDKGFLFKYLTHIYTNKNGSIYFFCYDHGYLP